MSISYPEVELNQQSELQKYHVRVLVNSTVQYGCCRLHS